MEKVRADRQGILNLKAGEWVEVRSREEILNTLDGSGRLENLPFMPEMLQYCGKKLRVYKRADKTCDYIQRWSIRRMKNAVHLEDARCDGSGHAGCEAGCLIFWKEAWLKRVDTNLVPIESIAPRNGFSVPKQQLVTVEEILAATYRIGDDGQTIYSCQGTDVPKFTSHMRMWDPRQYIRDIRSGNLESGLAGNSRAQRILDSFLVFLHVLRAATIGLFNDLQARRGGRPYPFIEGRAEKGPVESLDLQPGELVQVRSKEEIMATLGKNQKSRGLWFDSEMLPYCGGIYRVLRRVHRIIDERTGKILTMKNPCIVLEGVVCRSDFHRLCPRAIYPYWRESWLTRAANTSVSVSEQKVACHSETC